MLFGVVDELRSRLTLLDENVAALKKQLDLILARLEQALK